MSQQESKKTEKHHREKPYAKEPRTMRHKATRQQTHLNRVARKKDHLQKVLEKLGAKLGSRILVFGGRTPSRTRRAWSRYLARMGGRKQRKAKKTQEQKPAEVI